MFLQRIYIIIKNTDYSISFRVGKYLTLNNAHITRITHDMLRKNSMVSCTPL